MKHLNKVILLIVITLFSFCETKESDIEFEKKVMTQIFSSLIDSTCVDTRIFSNPPPIYGKYITEIDGHVSIDTSKATLQEKRKLSIWKENFNKIKKDTSKIIFAFDPLLKISHEKLDTDFENHFTGKKIFHSKKNENLNYTFDFEKINLNNKFNLKNISYFSKDIHKIWETKYNFVFSGIIKFSRIQFDLEKKFGIIEGGFYCGRLCGQGFLIFIKKENNKWIIDEIKETWIS